MPDTPKKSNIPKLLRLAPTQFETQVISHIREDTFESGNPYPWADEVIKRYIYDNRANLFPPAMELRLTENMPDEILTGWGAEGNRKSKRNASRFFDNMEDLGVVDANFLTNIERGNPNRSAVSGVEGRQLEKEWNSVPGLPLYITYDVPRWLHYNHNVSMMVEWGKDPHHRWWVDESDVEEIERTLWETLNWGKREKAWMLTRNDRMSKDPAKRKRAQRTLGEVIGDPLEIYNEFFAENGWVGWCCSGSCGGTNECDYCDLVDSPSPALTFQQGYSARGFGALKRASSRMGGGTVKSNRSYNSSMAMKSPDEIYGEWLKTQNKKFWTNKGPQYNPHRLIDGVYWDRFKSVDAMNSVGIVRTMSRAKAASTAKNIRQKKAGGGVHLARMVKVANGRYLVFERPKLRLIKRGGAR